MTVRQENPRVKVGASLRLSEVASRPGILLFRWMIFGFRSRPLRLLDLLLVLAASAFSTQGSQQPVGTTALLLPSHPISPYILSSPSLALEDRSRSPLP